MLQALTVKRRNKPDSPKTRGRNGSAAHGQTGQTGSYNQESSGNSSKKNGRLQIGIDLGTVNTLLYVGGRGIVFNEPSVIAFDIDTGNIIAVGHQAKRMIGKTHSKVKVVRPLNQGAISDKKAASSYLGFILRNSISSRKIDPNNTTILICCHSDLSSIERRALRDLAHDFGIKDVLVEEEIKAGAIGAGIDIFRASGTMVIDIGGGSTDIGVLALGDLVVSQSIKVAGNLFDHEIVKFFKLYRNFEIGYMTAEQIKLELATLNPRIKKGKTIDVAGRDLKTGLPGIVSTNQGEIRDILQRVFENIVSNVFKVLEETPPEISSDILDNGIILNGGGSLIDGVQQFFEERLNLPVRVAKDPLSSIAQGTKDLLHNRGNYLIKPND